MARAEASAETSQIAMAGSRIHAGSTRTVLVNGRIFQKTSMAKTTRATKAKTITEVIRVEGKEKANFRALSTKRSIIYASKAILMS